MLTQEPSILGAILTIAKLIMCEVDDGKQEAFSQSQSAWSQVSTCNGFVGQAGGWEASSSTAIILGFWESQFHVSEFMSTTHDEIYLNNKQQSTYRHCSVNYFELISTILGSEIDFSGAGVLRIAYCSRVLDIDRFNRDQQLLWNPQLSTQPGLLGGHVWRHIEHHDCYLVVTHWESPAAHEIYANNVLPKLRKIAHTSEYIEQLLGKVVVLDTKWNVTPYNG
ncbi:DUF4937 domain-containing protein [Shewanella sp. TB4-MNA-CIBAN-0142]|uniref:DUF4937 domain-containing protein n=1 Tax=Shewanella sp. TB4-MNA-CIBAN-0142 TaxID=3140464 RepID=UPI00331DF095